MIENPRLWSALADAWRRADWHDCLVTARMLADQKPDHDGLRFLLAALYLKVENPSLALLQYEKLLSSAVGRRDLYRAIAAQRQLDVLSVERGLHPRRYVAMLQWFRSVAPRLAGERAGVVRVTPGRLLQLEPDAFSNVSEGTCMEVLGLEPCDLAGADRCVLVFGRARCALPGASPPFAWEVEEGQPLLSGELADVPVRVLVTPERPCGLLRFGESSDACLGFAPELPAIAEAPKSETPAPAAPAPRSKPAAHAAKGSSRSKPSEPAAAPAPDVAPPAAHAAKGSSRPKPAEPAAAPAPGVAPPAAVPTPASASAPAPPASETVPAPSPTHVEIDFASREARVHGATTERALEGLALDLNAEHVDLLLEGGAGREWLRQHAHEAVEVRLDLGDGEPPLTVSGRVPAEAVRAAGADESASVVSVPVRLDGLAVLDAARLQDALLRERRDSGPDAERRAA